MRTTATSRPSETSDEVGLIIALLVRYPQIATIVSHPADGTVVLSFATRGTIERRTERGLRDAIVEHVRALLEHVREQPEILTVDCETDEDMSFVRITRDVRTFSRDELQLLVALLAERLGESLVQSPAADDDAFEDEGAADDLVEYAIEALREPEQQRSLVGFREEKRVLVYFVKARKKAKARARS